MSIEITSSTAPKAAPDRDAWSSMLRGWSSRCPACGTGSLYSGYLKVNDACPSCGEELHHHRADDAPPYFTIFIVGHLIVAGVLAVEDLWAPPSWVHAIVWTPLILASSLWMLPRIKGTLIGLQWANRMHGFSGENDDPAAPDTLQPTREAG